MCEEYGDDETLYEVCKTAKEANYNGKGIKLAKFVKENGETYN